MREVQRTALFYRTHEQCMCDCACITITHEVRAALQPNGVPAYSTCHALSGQARDGASEFCAVCERAGAPRNVNAVQTQLSCRLLPSAMHHQNAPETLRQHALRQPVAMSLQCAQPMALGRPARAQAPVQRSPGALRLASAPRPRSIARYQRDTAAEPAGPPAAQQVRSSGRHAAAAGAGGHNTQAELQHGAPQHAWR